MNGRNTAKLLRDFPRLYRGYRRPYLVSSMCVGLQCGDGWFDLLYGLSKKIDEALKRRPSEKTEEFAVIEVKEKFGELRCYVMHGTPEISRLIQETRWRS